MSCNKMNYPDKKAAVSAANLRVCGRRRIRRNRPEMLRAYFCDRCNGWHLTHKEKLS
jgi:hypothetical protein